MSQEENIISLIPQRPPMVMVDKLLEAGENSARTSFRIRAGNSFVENGVFRAAGLMENIAQTAAAGQGVLSRRENRPVLTGYIIAVKGLEINAFPKINDELVTEVRIMTRVFDIVVISGKITCNGIVMATCEMKVLINQAPPENSC